MLAHSYDAHKKKVVFPCFIQPKLDGVRCLAIKENGKITLLSRQKKEYGPLNHIKEALFKLMKDGEIWDGELFNKDITFQDLISLVKKDQPRSILVEYHAYDKVDDKFFGYRKIDIDDAIKNYWLKYNSEVNHIKSVLTIMIGSHDDINRQHSKFVEDGYEGAILRVGACTYKSGHRSHELLKVKSWLDEEFEIVDVVPDVHNTQGMFICKTKDGGSFKVRATGEDEEREYYLQNPEEFIGKMLTVKFFEWTSSDVPLPRFPVGLSIRDYE